MMKHAIVVALWLPFAALAQAKGATSKPGPSKSGPSKSGPSKPGPSKFASQKQKPTSQKSRPVDPAKQPRPKDAKALFAQFRGMTGLQAEFEEEKHLALLIVPIKSKGVLYFMRPGYLSRQVTSPEKSTVIVTPKELRIVRPDGREVIDLRSSKEVRQFVTSLVLVFRGDPEALAKSYEVAFTHDKKSTRGWSLRLVPKGNPMAKLVKHLTLRGEGRAVTAIELVEPKGDKTVTKIRKADPKRRFSAAEKKRLFGIASK